MRRHRKVALLLLVIITLLSTLNIWLQSASGTRWLLQGIAAVLPGELQVAEVKRYDDAITLRRLHYRGNDTALTVAELVVTWHPWQLLTATLAIETLHGRDITLQLPPDHPPAEPSQGLTLPLRLLLQDLRFEQLRIVQADEEAPLLIDSVALRGSYWWHTVAVEQLRVRALEARLATSGHLTTTAPYPLTMKGDWHYSLSSQQSVSGGVQLEGNLSALHASGQLSVSGGEADGIRSDWQAHYADSRLTLSPVTIRQPDGPGEILMSAAIDWTAGTPLYQLEGKLSEFDWPPAVAAARIERGEFQLTGNGQQYRLTAGAALTGAQLPRSQWQLQGSGSTTHFRVDALKGELLGGTLDAQGELRRAKEWEWNGEVALSAINPGRQWPEWPGSVNARATMEGSYQESVTLNVPQLSVDGVLRERKVSLRSTLSLQDGALKMEHMVLQSGSAKVQGHLSLDKQLQAELALNAPQMEALWPGATGELEAHLQAAGPPQQPHLIASWKGRTLRLGDYGVKALSGAVDMDLAGGSPWSISASADGLNPGNTAQPPFSVTLRGSGRAADHTLALSARQPGDGHTLAVELKGNWQRPRWQGEITALDIHSPLLGRWQQTAPTRLALSAEELLIDHGCLHSAPATVCLSYHQESTAAQRLQLSVTQFDLARLQALSAPYATIALPLDAEIDLTLTDSAPPHGRGRITLGGGTITPSAAIPTLASLPIKFDGGELLTSIDNGLLQSDTRLRVSANDELRITGQMPLGPQWRTQFTRQPLTLQLSTRINDMRLLEPLMEPLESIDGSLQADLRVSGNLSTPQLTGEAQLLIKQCLLPRLGLTIRDTELIARSDQPGHLSVSGHARSGKGQLHANGWFATEGKADWRSELSISGEQLEVSHIPEAGIIVSPQLQLRGAPLQLNISGEVKVDEARLEPRDLAMAQSPSSDVIVIKPEGSSEPAPRWSVNSDIRFIANDTIRLKGFGFEGHLGGNLRLLDEANRPPRAQGELHLVAGARYRAFGQDLKAEHGRLYFADTLIDNPNLDINAVRQVGDIVAGVKVEGTARQPLLTLFSRPAMDQTDILSYLTLGRPFSRAGVSDGNTMMQAANSAGLAGGDYLLGKVGSRFDLEESRIESTSDSGEPWLVLGRYLSPRLYVRYGVGLMETGSSVIMRYKLNDKWTLQGEGGRATGTDLLYSIERP